jgi:hypothetical protein
MAGLLQTEAAPTTSLPRDRAAGAGLGHASLRQAAEDVDRHNYGGRGLQKARSRLK